MIVGAIVGGGSDDTDSDEQADDTEQEVRDTTAVPSGSDSEAPASDAVETGNSAAGNVTEPAVTDTAAQTAPPATEAAGASATRERPALIGQAVTFTVDSFGDGDGSSWRLVVTGPGVSLNEAIAAENQFNDPPPDGMLFYGIPIAVTLMDTDKEPLSTLFNMEFEFFGPSTLTVIGLDTDSSCGVTPNAFNDFKEVFVGGSISGFVCFAVPQADADAGPLLTLDSNEGDRLFFASQGEIAPAADLSTPTTQPPSDAPSGARSNPVPIGQPVSFVVEAFGDGEGSEWQLVVDGPGVDLGAQILAENQFNDPPPDGSMFYAVPVSVTLMAANKEPLSPFANLELEYFGPSTLSIIGLDLAGSCGVVPDEYDSFTEVFIGGVVSGYLCFSVQVADVDAGVLVTLDSNDGERLFFSTR